MRVAVPTEVKNSEHRVAVTPTGVRELVKRGHEVIVQSGAGEGSSFTDDEYAEQGARLVDDAAEVWAAGELVVKVKEPVAEEFEHLRDDLALFTYLHLAADRAAAEALVAAGTTAIAYETVRLDSGLLPLLHPMSEVAGRLAPQVGAMAMTRPGGGRGVLLGGIGGVANARVVILGGGVVGQSAASMALGMGADVTVLDTDLEKLREILRRFDNRVRQIASSELAVRDHVASADLVIGTVLVPGSRAPKLVTNDMVAEMMPGSVLVDVAIDQGGCFEDSRPTTHDDPTYRVHESIFYCVANMPAAVPNTSTRALTNATLPYVMRIADHGWQGAMRSDPSLAKGLNVHGGRLIHPGVIAAFDDLDSMSSDESLAGK